MTEQKHFDVRIDRAARIITIQGIHYAFDLFDTLGFGAGAFRIGKREDGVVTLHILDVAEPAPNNERLGA